MGDKESLPGEGSDLSCASKIRWGSGIWRWRRKGWKGWKSMCKGMGSWLATVLFSKSFKYRQEKQRWVGAEFRERLQGQPEEFVFHSVCSRTVAWLGTWIWHYSVPRRTVEASGEMHRQRRTQSSQRPTAEANWDKTGSWATVDSSGNGETRNTRELIRTFWIWITRRRTG